jgi:hypothetical protein
MQACSLAISGQPTSDGFSIAIVVGSTAGDLDLVRAIAVDTSALRAIASFWS